MKREHVRNLKIRTKNKSATGDTVDLSFACNDLPQGEKGYILLQLILMTNVYSIQFLIVHVFGYNRTQNLFYPLKSIS